MRLNCSKNNKISIQEHLAWIRNLSMQNPAEVIRRHPQIAIHLSNGCDLSRAEKISGKIWQHVLRSFYFSTLVGPHKNLIKIFSLSPDFSSTEFTIGSHRLHSVLGIGSDSCVYKTVDGYCLKVTDCSRREKLKKEYELLRSLQHPHIVKSFKFIDSAGYAAMMMEELSPALGDGKAYIRALDYCHSQGILHGDIRLNNLGTDTEGNSKLFDFGNASAMQSLSEAQKEIEILKNIMRSPIALERKSILTGEVLC